MYSQLKAVELEIYIEQLPQTIKGIIKPFDENVYISVLQSLLNDKPMSENIILYNTDKEQQVRFYTQYIKNEIKFYIREVFSEQ